ncbi:MAG: hypothetical protein ACRD4E_15600 [Bryobacteraceae bacterium]
MQTKKVLSTPVHIPLGTTVVNQNKKTGFYTNRFRGMFRNVSAKELSKLAPGAIIYKKIGDSPTRSTYGVIDGVAKAEIIEIRLSNGIVWVEYGFGTPRGDARGISIDADRTSFYSLTVKEGVLADILDELPKQK